MSRGNDQRIERIQSSGCRAVWVVTGGGSGALHAMLSHPGASRFLLEAQIPYSGAALRQYLDQEPESCCAAETARLMADRAYERALVFTLPDGGQISVIGIACTAALQTRRKRRGDDRAYFCIRSGAERKERRIDLSPGSRMEQEEAVSCALLEFIEDFLEGAA